jgi:hypothetical protein
MTAAMRRLHEEFAAEGANSGNSGPRQPKARNGVDGAPGDAPPKAIATLHDRPPIARRFGTPEL